jgi:hypothetical protein
MIVNYDYTKKLLKTVCFKWMNCTVSQLYLSEEKKAEKM